MNCKNYFQKSLCAFLFLIFPMIGYAMDTQSTLRQKTASTSRLKISISGFMTALNLGVSIAPFWMGAASFAKQEFDFYQNQNKNDQEGHESRLEHDAKAFIRRELAKYNVVGAEKFPVNLQVSRPEEKSDANTLTTNGSTNGYTLQLGFEYSLQELRIDSVCDDSSFDDLLYKKLLSVAQDRNFEPLWNKYRFTIGHEANHITNNDLQKRGVALFLLPVCTHVAFSMLPFPLKSFWLQQVIKFPSGITKCIINNQLLNFHSRCQEQQADEGVINDIAILQAGKEDFENIRTGLHSSLYRCIIDGINDLKPSKVHPNFRKIVTYFNNLSEEQKLKKLAWIEFFLDPIHPSLDYRIARLQKRIDELLKKERDRV